MIQNFREPTRRRDILYLLFFLTLAVGSKSVPENFSGASTNPSFRALRCLAEILSPEHARQYPPLINLLPIPTTFCISQWRNVSSPPLSSKILGIKTSHKNKRRFSHPTFLAANNSKRYQEKPSSKPETKWGTPTK